MNNIFTSIRRWHRGNVAIAELSKLSDHMLADIGVSRHEIRKVARGLK